MYNDVSEYFEHFWCLFDGEDMIGTVALKKLDSDKCELKSLYLLEQYHKKGLGRLLLNTVIQEAKRNGYGTMYLDTLSSSKRAVRLYEKAGFPWNNPITYALYIAWLVIMIFLFIAPFKRD